MCIRDRLHRRRRAVPDQDHDRRGNPEQGPRQARHPRRDPRRADRAVRVRAALPHGGDHARRPAHAQGHAPRYLHAYPDAALQLLRFAPARQDPDPRGQLCEHAFGHAELRSDQRDLRRVHLRDHADRDVRDRLAAGPVEPDPVPGAHHLGACCRSSSGAPSRSSPTSRAT